MRDGVALHTRVFVPGLSAGQRVGTIIIRTPYGIDAAGSAGDIAASYAAMGWAAVAQDERGRFASEGAYTFWRSAANDTYDTLAFIADQAWSNGRVAQTGGSANAIHGYVVPLASPGPPPQLVAQFNIVGTSLLHQTVFQGGAYRQGLITGWLDGISEPEFATEVVTHEGYSSDWWGSITQSANGGQGLFNLTNFPILHAAGWYDIFSTSQINTFNGLQAYGGPAARGSQILVVEPGGHCASGAISWPNASWGWDLASDYSLELFAATIGLPAVPAPASAAAVAGGVDARAKLVRALRNEMSRVKAPLGVAAAEDSRPLPPPGLLRRLLGRVGGRGAPVAGKAEEVIIWYVLGPGTPGSLGNIWASAPSWPTTTPTRLFMHADGSLQAAPPTGAPAQLSWQQDAWLPVPTLGGNNLILSPCGPQDQRPIEALFGDGGLLLFSSAPLQEALIVNGLMQAELQVSSDAPDIDVAVKVTDVFPSGESMLVQDGILRMRWRGGPAQEQHEPWMVPGAFYNITVDVGFMSYVFNVGHRVRVAVASSNAQRFSVNPQDKSPLVVNATGGALAHNRLKIAPGMPGALLLPLLSQSALDAIAL